MGLVDLFIFYFNFPFHPTRRNLAQTTQSELLLAHLILWIMSGELMKAVMAALIPLPGNLRN
jgi:hypothetical protein